MMRFQLPENAQARFVEFCIDHGRAISRAVGITTILMLFIASTVRVQSNLADHLPVDHPYIAVHEKYKTAYGTSNAVTIVMEVADGDIFRTGFLQQLQALTFELRKVDGVNPEQVVSLASRTIRDVRFAADGWDISPLMFPHVPEDAEGLMRLRARVIENDMAYGRYVSPDMKAALISVDFYDHLLSPPTAFHQIRSMVDRLRADDVTIRIAGEPMLAGWVAYHLPQSLLVLVSAVAVLGVLLFLLNRSLRGTFLPLLAGVMSAIWALGFAAIADISLDPLLLVIAFLITARAISHSVQLVIRFDDEMQAGTADSVAAAKSAMSGLLRPGMLGVVADAACVAVLAFIPIPIVQKVAVVGSVWMLTIAVTAVVMTPILLSRTKLPMGQAKFAIYTIMPAMRRALRVAADVAVGKARYACIGGATVLLGFFTWQATALELGSSATMSPLLRADAEYNKDAAGIAKLFPGIHRMFVVFEGANDDDIKRPDAMQQLLRFQRHAELHPGVVATVSIADLTASVRRLLHGGHHRYEEPGRTAVENGELLYILSSGTDARDIVRFTDERFMTAPVLLFLRDLGGTAARNALSHMKAFKEDASGRLQVMFAGGSVAVVAAVNEAISEALIPSIALALIALALCCSLAYRSLVAGSFFLVPVLLSNAATFSVMAWHGIAMNVHTLPVAALGIALGVDYSFYVVDAIREQSGRNATVRQAVRAALDGAGRGVLITAGALTVSLLVWNLSALRFQSEMALLMAVWIFVSAASALILMPALAVVFKPEFIFQSTTQDPDERHSERGFHLAQQDRSH